MTRQLAAVLLCALVQSPAAAQAAVGPAVRPDVRPAVRPEVRLAVNPAGHLSVPSAALWWPGFIDVKGKVFLELPADTKICATAREVLRRARLEPGRIIALPLKAEALLPRGARLAFGVTDGAGVSSERVLTRIVAIARGVD